MVEHEPSAEIADRPFQEVAILSFQAQMGRIPHYSPQTQMKREECYQDVQRSRNPHLGSMIQVVVVVAVAAAAVAAVDTSEVVEIDCFHRNDLVVVEEPSNPSIEIEKL